MIEDLVHQFRPDCVVRVIYTDNTYTMSRVRQNNGVVTFRLHRIFRSAPVEVLEALTRLHFVRQPRYARRRLAGVVRRYINENAAAIRPRKSRRPAQRLVEPRGVFVDLLPLFEEMNRRYFGGHVRARITWSRGVHRRQMGCCRDADADDLPLIVINRLLDDPAVPRYYLDFLIVHEMLHCLYPKRTLNGRTVRHPPELRAFERKLPFYQQAIAWEKGQVDKLYRQRMNGRHAQMVLPFLR